MWKGFRIEKVSIRTTSATVKMNSSVDRELFQREAVRLKEKVDLLIRRIFEVKSKKLDSAKLELLL
jgi:hypothetical protein